jgi:hypothetical protein
MIRRAAVALGRSERARAAGLALALVLGASSGCTTNHDALAKQPKAGSTGGGSAGSSGFGAGGFGNTGDMPNQGGRPNPDFEPAGDDVLTIVNGVVDAPSVRLCFGRLTETGEAGELVGAPLPTLAYAASAVLTELEGFSFADDAIVPWTFAGDFSLLEGLDCNEALELAIEEEAKVTPVEPDEGSGGASGEAGAAGAAGVAGAPEIPLEMPALRARPLAALPAGTVNIGRSILMVLTGCIGGAAYTDAIDTSVCGEGYDPSTPTLQPLVVKLSRTPGFDKVGLQAVLASQAVVGTIDVRASGDDGTVSLTFASSVSFGAIEPRPADVRFGSTELGLARRDFGLQAVADNGVLFQESWSEIREASGLATIEPTRNYTAILLGPDPLLLKQGWWNGSAFSLVDNDPTRD